MSQDRAELQFTWYWTIHPSYFPNKLVVAWRFGPWFGPGFRSPTWCGSLGALTTATATGLVGHGIWWGVRLGAKIPNQSPRECFFEVSNCSLYPILMTWSDSIRCRFDVLNLTGALPCSSAVRPIGVRAAEGRAATSRALVGYTWSRVAARFFCMLTLLAVSFGQGVSLYTWIHLDYIWRIMFVFVCLLGAVSIVLVLLCWQSLPVWLASFPYVYKEY